MGPKKDKEAENLLCLGDNNLPPEVDWAHWALQQSESRGYTLQSCRKSSVKPCLAAAQYYRNLTSHRQLGNYHLMSLETDSIWRFIIAFFEYCQLNHLIPNSLMNTLNIIMWQMTKHSCYLLAGRRQILYVDRIMVYCRYAILCVSLNAYLPRCVFLLVLKLPQ